MSLTLLCVGDVVGRPGRQALLRLLPILVRQHDVDCVIANVENAAGGSGLTPPLYEKFRRYGVDVLTAGDHVYKKRVMIPHMGQADRLVRPANLPPQAPGKELVVCEAKNGVRVAVISVLGRLYMKPLADCPFHAVDRMLAAVPSDVKVIVVDIHAEATSEKVAMGWHLDGRVSVVFGTHTHVPTADERILPRGTAYITDLGMTGPYDSVLGRRKDRVLQTLITSLPSTFDVATGDPRLAGIVVRVDEHTGRAEHIERILLDADRAEAYADQLEQDSRS